MSETTRRRKLRKVVGRVDSVGCVAVLTLECGHKETAFYRHPLTWRLMKVPKSVRCDECRNRTE